ncbi:MAG: NADH-quinone oxidoreductase subunit L [Sulfurovum sp.]|nr:NADH-quinone oxidoreductase subunit L [Sulfurovum sp.]MCB4745001.1 NADH-quinone oxidoreductase subunit L [Sulfurovum sp.]MCB4746132.1 NADH-quinone oxidoreductase subunit L [Sulfurovum sp.]MCB4748172.1 NADH-quinone oxidoreductase subunit L [Sulfurovum sp.]MCB4749580.1 NADH-quinone oxidoreductase subunit L [Sulfurovum sp.]
MENLIYIALFAPFVGSLFAALFGMSERRIFVGIIGSALIGISFLASAMLALYVFQTGKGVHVTMMDWISAGDLHIPFGFMIDQVSVTMMTVVTLVSTIVHIYSIGYMDHDKSFNRFFSYLSAFVFSMMVLVMSDNFAGLFIGWEGVGVCSWLLVGFWYHKPDQTREENPSISPSWAANEAFIMNRIADLGMLIGLFIIYWNVGSLQYNVVFSTVPELSGTVLNAVAIALFIGAMGKSAQFPLHTWLTDAMEGPTPVSALIHAATMVTAGVFLVIRANPIFGMTPEVSYFIAALGTFVAFFAASMALVNRDLKRIIAFSTLSQLGYMFAAAGLGAYWIALFHLAAHAFFKALLFLGAGNVMHAMHDELDIFKMGGLKRVMKWSYIYMGVASLALAGIPFFAGFFSKDAIIETAWNEGTIVLWAILVITAGMTAFYSFRQVFLTFKGNERYPEEINYFKDGKHHPHEMYGYVLIAMSPLAILAVVAGFGMNKFEHFVTKLLPEYHMSEHTHHIAWILGFIVLIFAVGGIVLAYKKYYKELKRDDILEQSWYYKLLANQYYIPNIYEEFITKPYAMISDMMWNKIDLKIVDTTVDGIAKFLYKTGDSSRKMQTGNLSNYLNWMAVGAVLLLVAATISVVVLG